MESGNLPGMNESHIGLFREKMREAGLSEIALKNFEFYYQKLLEGDRGTLPSNDINVPGEFPRASSIDADTSELSTFVDKVCIIKLNGGLGTSMGLDRAKSLLPAIGEMSFLDVIMHQVLSLRKKTGVEVPLLFMNSFRTEEDTLAVAESYPEFLQKNRGLPISFVQNRVPRICAQTLKPISWEENSELEWCPPGHGEIYTVLLETGTLQKALAAGIQYAFISNADNLAATMDPAILKHLMNTQAPFLMEVATRTISDRKGGHLARTLDGRLVLRELAQCPEEDLDDFQDFEKYNYFNTNSLWVDLRALDTTLKERSNVVGLPLICNKKNVDPGQKDSPAVFQLETAMGAAIGIFEGAQALHVGRERFMPVKTTDQLLDLGSDSYAFDSETGRIELCREDRIVISLDSRYYGHIKSFQERFPNGFPSLKKCTTLKVTGDVVFGKNVVCKGEVEIINESGTQVALPDGENLSGRMVFN